MKYAYQVADAHCDTLSKLLDSGEELFSGGGHINLEHLLQYDGYVQFFAAWIDEKKENWLSRALEILDYFYRELEKNSDKMVLITEKASLRRAAEEKKIGAVLAIEDARALCGSLANLRMLHRLGVRAVALSWNHDNDVADGALTERNRGLTDFGRSVVREMNRLGMMIDVSHMSPKGFWDVAEESRAPFFASHSNCAAVLPHKRNLDDEQIREIIRVGGVIGLNFYPEFLAENGSAGIDDILRHAEHILSLGGEHALALGTDFDGIRTLPREIRHAGDLHLLFEKMKEIGYEDSLIADICGGNLRKFLEKML